MLLQLHVQINDCKKIQRIFQLHMRRISELYRDCGCLEK